MGSPSEMPSLPISLLSLLRWLGFWMPMAVRSSGVILETVGMSYPAAAKSGRYSSKPSSPSQAAMTSGSGTPQRTMSSTLPAEQMESWLLAAPLLPTEATEAAEDTDTVEALLLLMCGWGGRKLLLLLRLPLLAEARLTAPPPIDEEDEDEAELLEAKVLVLPPR